MLKSVKIVKSVNEMRDERVKKVQTVEVEAFELFCPRHRHQHHHHAWTRPRPYSRSRLKPTNTNSWTTRTHASRGFTQFSPELDAFDFCCSRPFMSVNVNMDTRKNRPSSTTFLAQKPSQNSSRSRARRLGQVRGFPECTRGLLSSKLLPVVAP